jgi:hypothetical protein
MHVLLLLLRTKGKFQRPVSAASCFPLQRSCIQNIFPPKCFVSLSVVSLKMERVHSAAAAVVDSPHFNLRPAREREAALR